MLDIDKILDSLEEIKQSLILMKKQSISESIDFDELKLLLHSDIWPQAIPSELICDTTSEEDKINRANGILNIIIQQSLKDKKFLDFGCGEGHIVKESIGQNTTLSVGYDINQQGTLEWEGVDDKFLLTTNFDRVMDKGPFDIILLYDVLDHCENPVETLKQIKTVCKKDTTIYVRCHPWCSRHGGHLYNQINKAWVHLIFTKDELEKMGYKVEKINKTLFPIATYTNYFKISEFSVVGEPDIQRTNIEDFFKQNELVVKRLATIFGKPKFPEFQMSQDFLDFVIKP